MEFTLSGTRPRQQLSPEKPSIAYAKGFVASVLGQHHSPLPEAFLRQIADTLARTEELGAPRDEWGNWEPQFSGQLPHEYLTPWLDKALLSHAEASGETERWPDGHRFALCLTHDVDGVSSRGHAARLFRRLGRLIKAEGPKSVAAMQAAGSLYRLLTAATAKDKLGRFEDWLDIETRYDFHSTWYFLPSHYSRAHVYDMDYRYSDRVVFDGEATDVSAMMRAIASAGNDIGLHGSYLSSEDSALLSEQRLQVEAVVGRPVASVRQHFLRYAAAKTAAAQDEAGLRSDSTQGFNTTIGFRAGTSFPYWTWDHHNGRALSVLEIPLHIMDAPLMRLAQNSVRSAVKLSVLMMEEVEQLGGCLTLNFHPNLIERPGYLAVYASLLEIAASKNAWGCSAAELHAHWSKKRKA
jgi:peptidoglycan/xylan/chitin deacetylase (PgdA/CDA1 family)